GCGRVANVHAGGYKKASETKLLAASDIDESKLKAFSKEWEVSGQYTDYEEMLEKEELDIVSICTKDNQHPEPTIKAAESGVKGILCEKPMAYTLEEADKMIEACDAEGLRSDGTAKANVKLSIDHSMRFEANYRKLFEIAQSGEIGKLRCVHFNVLGGSTSIESLLHETHSFDAYLFYAGADASWLSARVQKQDNKETITGYISFKNGIYATFEYGGRRNYGTYELILEGSDGTLSAVHGKRNSLDLNGAYSWEPFVRIWKKSDGGLTGFRDGEPIETEKSDPWLAGIEELVQCIKEDRESISSGKVGRVSLEMIMAIYESERQNGARIKFPLS
nr:Gfo/Idh/MocA family oxidoreductase [Chloroflexota bacterium]